MSIFTPPTRQLCAQALRRGKTHTEQQCVCVSWWDDGSASEAMYRTDSLDKTICVHECDLSKVPVWGVIDFYNLVFARLNFPQGGH